LLLFEIVGVIWLFLKPVLAHAVPAASCEIGEIGKLVKFSPAILQNNWI